MTDFPTFSEQPDVESHQTRAEVSVVKKTIKQQCWLRWLDWIFLGGYLPSLSINYIAMSKDMGKRLPQLYYI